MTPADMREAVALAVLEAGPDCPHIIAAVAAIRALPIPEAPALPGIDLAAIQRRWDPMAIPPHGADAVAQADVPALCAALRSVTASRDAWVRAAFSAACDGPEQLAERLAALVAERDAQRSAAEGWAHQAHEVEGRYEGACEERERMRGAMEEARGHLETIAAQYEGCDLGSAIGRALAALTSAGQERAEPVPTPEEMAAQLYPAGTEVNRPRDVYAAGIRAERARRGTAPVQPVPTAEEPSEDEHMLTCAYYTSFAGDADSMCDCGVRTRRGGSHA